MANYMFTGKRVLVTGASGGLGKSILKKFYEAGAIVFALDKDKGALDELLVDMPDLKILCIDLLDRHATRTAIENIGPLDHLINNAGVPGMGYLIDIEPEQIDLVFGVNFKAVLNVSQAFALGVSKKENPEGTIVNVSSNIDCVAIGGAGLYSCSKAALTQLTKCLALELNSFNIRVNAVRPGPLDTPMLRNVDPKYMQDAERHMSRPIIKSQIQTSDVAEVILFLSSPLTSMITGETVAVDGGASAN